MLSVSVGPGILAVSRMFAGMEQRKMQRELQRMADAEYDRLPPDEARRRRVRSILAPVALIVLAYILAQYQQFPWDHISR